jgi:hypothetical protein
MTLLIIDGGEGFNLGAQMISAAIREVDAGDAG